MIGIKFDEIRDLTNICWISYIFNRFSISGGCGRIVFGLLTPEDGLWCSSWILAGGLRPPDLPPGGLRPPGPPEVWLSYATGWPSYATLMGITCRPL